MTRAVQIKLKQRINSALNNEQMVLHQNGLERISLSATVTRVSNFVEENVCVLLFFKAPLPVPMHTRSSGPYVSSLSEKSVPHCYACEISVTNTR